MADTRAGAATQQRLFRNRRHAGRVLAGLLRGYRAQPGVIVLGLPRGGVPVAYEIAVALGAPLDVFVVRKLGVPGRDEFAMGAIASGGVVVLNEDVVRALNIGPPVLQRVAEAQARELLRRERTYRHDRPPPDLRGRMAILVDDGLATGASMRAAVQALRQLRPGRIVVAVPAAPEVTRLDVAAQVDEVICAATPSPFYAVGAAYWDFTQTSDEEVRKLLRATRQRCCSSLERNCAHCCGTFVPGGRPSCAVRCKWREIGTRSCRRQGSADMMRAHAGDHIIVASPTTGGAMRDGKIIEVRGADGTPPYVVLWSDSANAVLFFPGVDARVDETRTRDAAFA